MPRSLRIYNQQTRQRQRTNLSTLKLTDEELKFINDGCSDSSGDDKKTQRKCDIFPIEKTKKRKHEEEKKSLSQKTTRYERA